MCQDCKRKFREKYPYYNYSKIEIDEKGEKKMVMIKKYICREHPTSQLSVVEPVGNEIHKYICGSCNKPVELIQKKEADELVIKEEQRKVKKETEESEGTEEIKDGSKVKKTPKKVNLTTTPEQEKELIEIKEKLKETLIKLFELRKSKKETPTDETKLLVKNTLKELQLLRKRKEDIKCVCLE